MAQCKLLCNIPRLSTSTSKPVSSLSKPPKTCALHVGLQRHAPLGLSSSPLSTAKLVCKSKSVTPVSSCISKRNEGLSVAFEPTTFLGKFGKLGSKSWNNLQDKRSVNSKASDPSSYQGYPPMTKKPAWWWRVLACLPYMVSLHIAWIHAEETYDLHPLMELYEWYTYPFLTFLGELPGWFFTFYFFLTYLGIVRENKWPHFFRCHMITGMLLEMTMEVCMTVSEFIPSLFIEGQTGMYLWFFISWSFLLTAFGCLFCALRGMYADVPFLSKAAYLQVPY